MIYLNIVVIFGVIVVIVVFFFWKNYFLGYVSEKGKNFVMKEDIVNLINIVE